MRFRAPHEGKIVAYRRPAAAAASPPSRAGWPEGPARPLHEPRNRTKARVWLVGQEPDAVVVKEIGAVPAWFRPLARRLLRREASAYRALDGLAGFPRLLAQGSDYIVMSFVAGTPLPRLASPPGEAFFDAIDALVGEIHARGVACGDLHHRNVLVDAAGRPHLVDFALAVTGEGWLFRRLAELDRTAALRMRLRYLHRDPTPGESARLRSGQRLWRAGRFLKRGLGVLRPRAGSSLPNREHTP